MKTTLFKFFAIVLTFLVLLYSIPVLGQETTKEAAESSVKPNSTNFRFSYGGKLGNTFSSNIIFFTQGIPFEWESTSSILIGGTTEVKFLENFAIQADVVFTKRGYTLRPLADYKLKYNMIHVPILFKTPNLARLASNIFLGYPISDEFLTVSGGIGPPVGYIIGGYTKSEGVREKLPLKEMGIKKLQWGVTASLMFETEVMDKHRFGIHFSGNLGFTNASPSPIAKGFLKAFDISVVYYLPNRKKHINKTLENQQNNS